MTPSVFYQFILSQDLRENDFMQYNERFSISPNYFLNHQG